MQVGMTTLIELDSLEECAALCQELGLDFIELSMSLLEFQTDRLDVDELREIAKRYGMYYTIHFDENLNPFDFNSLLAAASTGTVLQTIEIAKRLGVPILNMHLNGGTHFTLPDRKAYLYEKYESHFLDRLTAFRDVCELKIGDSGIKICVENCGDFAVPYKTAAIDLLLQSTAFALTFDIGHNATASFSDEPIIMARSGRLRHMHIHDANVKRNHLVLGEGELDLNKYLNLAKSNNCREVIEVKTVDGLRRSVDWMRERNWIAEGSR